MISGVPSAQPLPSLEPPEMFDTDEYLWLRDLAIVFWLLAVFGAALGASLLLWS